MMAIYFGVSKYLCQVSGGYGYIWLFNRWSFFWSLSSLTEFWSSQNILQISCFVCWKLCEFRPGFLSKGKPGRKMRQKWETSCNHNMKFQIYSAKNDLHLYQNHPKQSPGRSRGGPISPLASDSVVNLSGESRVGRLACCFKQPKSDKQMFGEYGKISEILKYLHLNWS